MIVKSLNGAENNNSILNTFYWMLVVKMEFNDGLSRTPFPWVLSSSKSNCQTSVASTIIGCFKKCKEIVHNFDLIQVQFWVQSYFQFCKSSHVLQNHMFFSKLVESLTLHQGIFISLAQPFKYQTNIYPYIL